MNKKSLVIFSSLFVLTLFLMSACNTDAVGSRRRAIDRDTGNLGCGGNDANCPSDRYVGSFFCQNGNVYRNFKDNFCNTNSCVSNTTAKLIDNCGANEICIDGEGSCQFVGGNSTNGNQTNFTG